MSEDPIGLASSDLNFYRYAFSSPVNLNDPSGLDVYTCSSNEGDYPHDYLAVNGRTGGLTPANEISKIEAFYGSTPGGDQGGPSPGSAGATCKIVEAKNKKQAECLDKCTSDILDAPRPNYSIRGKGMACKEFVRRTVEGCQAACGN